MDEISKILEDSYIKSLSARDHMALNNRIIEIEKRLEAFGFINPQIYDPIPGDPRFLYDGITSELDDLMYSVGFGTQWFSWYILSDLLHPALNLLDLQIDDKTMQTYISIESLKNQGLNYELDEIHEAFHPLYIGDFT